MRRDWAHVHQDSRFKQTIQLVDFPAIQGCRVLLRLVGRRAISCLCSSRREALMQGERSFTITDPATDADASPGLGGTILMVQREQSLPLLEVITHLPDMVITLMEEQAELHLKVERILFLILILI